MHQVSNQEIYNPIKKNFFSTSKYVKPKRNRKSERKRKTRRTRKKKIETEIERIRREKLEKIERKEREIETINIIYSYGKNDYYDCIDDADYINDYDGDCNGPRTHNHLVRKRTLNYLAKLAK